MYMKMYDMVTERLIGTCGIFTDVLINKSCLLCFFSNKKDHLTHLAILR